MELKKKRLIYVWNAIPLNSGIFVIWKGQILKVFNYWHRICVSYVAKQHRVHRGVSHPGDEHEEPCFWLAIWGPLPPWPASSGSACTASPHNRPASARGGSMLPLAPMCSLSSDSASTWHETADDLLRCAFQRSSPPHTSGCPPCFSAVGCAFYLISSLSNQKKWGNSCDRNGVANTKERMWRTCLFHYYSKIRQFSQKFVFFGMEWESLFYFTTFNVLFAFSA